MPTRIFPELIGYGSPVFVEAPVSRSLQARKEISLEDLMKYSGQPIDVAVRQIYKSQASILIKADALYKLKIDVLDPDTRAYTARILSEADASGITNESIELLRAAFKVELANGGFKPRKGIRKAEDVPRVDPPIWTSLDNDPIK